MSAEAKAQLKEQEEAAKNDLFGIRAQLDQRSVSPLVRWSVGPLVR